MTVTRESISGVKRLQDCLKKILSGVVFLSMPALALESKTMTWKLEDAGVTLSLTQITPDQATAFYLGRGFTPEASRLYAQSCVFMTVLRNDSKESGIHFKLENWRIRSADGIHPIPVLDQWEKQWKSQGLSKSARIAFRWAQFPREQEYQPGGDWNQGMLAMKLPPGSVFDLQATWDSDNHLVKRILKNVQCAE